MKILPVVMSGGSGTRLWPVSRTKFPKQFCDLIDQPLHTMTLKRLEKYDPALIVTSILFRDLTESDLRIHQFKIEKALYEPQPKNTAPAIAFVCRYLEMQNRLNQVIGVFSSDNLILNESEFHKAVNAAQIAAEQDQVVTLGVKPDKAETGFGYIQVRDRAVGTLKPTPVLKFHEKPTPEVARQFFNEGSYFWNAGIFVFKVSKMIELFQKYEPEIWSQFQKLKPDLSNLSQIYADIKNISIDYAILEKLNSSEMSCVTCDIGWSDLGSWDSLMEVRDQHKKQDLQNTVEVAAKGNAVIPQEGKNYSFIGVDDLIVVDTQDALLICKKGESQKLKELVQKINVKNDKLTKEHVFENRPWGRFEVLKDQGHFKSKIIRVDAGQKLSYQSHAKRAEHWILVKGQAIVVLNDQEISIKAGEHIFIPQGAKHRIMNPTQSVVEFIEVQVGSYFGEDDIVRYQDDYGRKQD